MWKAHVFVGTNEIILNPEFIDEKIIEKELKRKGYNVYNFNPDQIKLYRQTNIEVIKKWISYFTSRNPDFYSVFKNKDKKYAIISDVFCNWKVTVTYDTPSMPSICLKKIEKGAVNDQYVGNAYFEYDLNGDIRWIINPAQLNNK